MSASNIRLLDPGVWNKFTYLMTNSVDPNQLLYSEANWSGSILFAEARQVISGFSKTPPLFYSIIFRSPLKGNKHYLMQVMSRLEWFSFQLSPEIWVAAKSISFLLTRSIVDKRRPRSVCAQLNQVQGPNIIYVKKKQKKKKSPRSACTDCWWAGLLEHEHFTRSSFVHFEYFFFSDDDIFKHTKISNSNISSN